MDRLKGNLLNMADNGEFDVIVHGCNCFHAMGSGIARQIAMRFPEAEQADFATAYGSKKKLGDFSYAKIEGKTSKEFIVVNAYTQYKWSGAKDVFEYEAFDDFLNRLSGFAYALHEHKGDTLRIGFPKIGCGFAKGKEPRIMNSLERFSQGCEPWAITSLVTLP